MISIVIPKKISNLQPIIINTKLNMKHLICILFATLLSINAFAQDFEIVRNPMPQEEFKELIYQKYSNFEKRKLEDKKLPKLKKEDTIEILSSVPFNDDGSFTISYVRQVEGLDKETLYDNIYQSLVDVFVSAKNILQMQDKETGILVCKGMTEGNLIYSMGLMGKYAGSVPTHFTLKIQVRDGRYKIDLYDIYVEKGDLDDTEAPIETYLTKDFYLTSFVSDGLGLSKSKRTDAHYINVRTQVLLEQLYRLYQIENNIFDGVSQLKTEEEDW